MADDRYRVQSLGRACDLLDLIAAEGGEGARLTDLAQGLSLSKAATYAILQTLLARGLAADVGEGMTRRYRLGMALARLGEQAVANLSLAELAAPALRELSRESGMTSRMAVLEDGHAVVVARFDGPGAIRFDSALGRREWPHCSAVGKALLSTLPRREAEAILRRSGLPRRTPRTLTSMAAVLRALALTAERGYALDDEEDMEGVVCVGACVFERSGAAAGAISVTGLKQRSWPDREPALGRLVRRHAARLTRALGGPVQPGPDEDA
jgi:IclR family acetate operon transcriptional repressor